MDRGYPFIVSTDKSGWQARPNAGPAGRLIVVAE
jgi:hypothetical protein